jgi:uncharacterized protein DUF302
VIALAPRSRPGRVGAFSLLAAAEARSAVRSSGSLATIAANRDAKRVTGRSRHTRRDAGAMRSRAWRHVTTASRGCRRRGPDQRRLSRQRRPEPFAQITHMVDLTGSGDADQVEARLREALEAHGLQRFARIDHATGARKADVELEGNVLLIFDNTRVGTPLMQADPRVGIELPLRMLIWQDSRRDACRLPRAGRPLCPRQPPADARAAGRSAHQAGRHGGQLSARPPGPGAPRADGRSARPGCRSDARSSPPGCPPVSTEVTSRARISRICEISPDCAAALNGCIWPPDQASGTTSTAAQVVRTQQSRCGADRVR